jgi:hypothetical protein
LLAAPFHSPTDEDTTMQSLSTTDTPTAAEIEAEGGRLGLEFLGLQAQVELERRAGGITIATRARIDAFQRKAAVFATRIELGRIAAERARRGEP